MTGASSTGIVETSVAWASKTEAQAAADKWVNLDEDWAGV